MGAQEEHDYIVKSYSRLFNAVDRLPGSILITTKDDEKFDVKWTSGGWIMNDQVFESFESGMMSLSPSFAQVFHDELMRKLQDVSP